MLPFGGSDEEYEERGGWLASILLGVGVAIVDAIVGGTERSTLLDGDLEADPDEPQIALAEDRRGFEVSALICFLAILM